MSLTKGTLQTLALVGAAAVLAPASAWAQTATDVDCTECVDTPDIADQAVTGNKLAQSSILTGKFADGSVTGNKLANGSILTGKFADQSVTGNKIAQGAILAGKLANGAVRTGKILDAAVTGDKLADQAVTGNKIADAAVTGAKLADQAVTGNKIADGAIAAAKLGLIGTVFVEADGLSDTDNCDSLIAALSGLAGPAVVALGPGTYDCQTQSVIVPANVALIGSGRNVTTITGSLGTPFVQGLVSLNSGSELRHLAVTNIGNIDSGNQMFAVSAAGENWHVGDVTLLTMDGPTVTTGLFTSTTSPCDGVTLTNVKSTADADTGGVRAFQLGCSSGVMNGYNLHGIAQGASLSGVGIIKFGDSDTVTVHSSSFKGARSARSLGGTLRIISSELDGTASGTVLKCVAAYDQNGDPLADGTFGSGGCIKALRGVGRPAGAGRPRG